MSNLQLNRRKPIRLPFSTAPKASARLNQVEQTDCGICAERKSKYVCPRCNIFYCSLDCFRSNNHVQCSEPFYAATIKQQIHQLPSRTPEEKKAMLQILERFERGGSGEVNGRDSGATGVEEMKGNGVGAESLESLYRSLVSETGSGGTRQDPSLHVGDEQPEGDDEEQEEYEDEEDGPENEVELQDLASRLDGIDLESIAPQDLFALLPARHRKRFIQLLEKEGSRDRLIRDAQEDALDVEDGEQESGGVWWTPSGLALDLPREEDVVLSESDVEKTTRESAPVRPEAIEESLVKGIMVPSSSVEGLKFNLVAICMAYIVLIRTMRLPQGIIQSLTSSATSQSASTIQSSRNLLSTLVPFLFDPKSTWKARALREVEEEVFGGIENIDMRSAILEDLLHLVHPPLTVSDTHPVLLAISDLAALFAQGTNLSAKEKAIRKKLEFYYVLARSIRRVDWVALEGLVKSRIETLQGDEEEEDEGQTEKQRSEDPLVVPPAEPKRVGPGVQHGPKIVEL